MTLESEPGMIHPSPPGIENPEGGSTEEVEPSRSDHSTEYEEPNTTNSTKLLCSHPAYRKVDKVECDYCQRQAVNEIPLEVIGETPFSTVSNETVKGGRRSVRQIISGRWIASWVGRYCPEHSASTIHY